MRPRHIGVSVRAYRAPSALGLTDSDRYDNPAAHVLLVLGWLLLAILAGRSAAGTAIDEPSPGIESRCIGKPGFRFVGIPVRIVLAVRGDLEVRQPGVYG